MSLPARKGRDSSQSKQSKCQPPNERVHGQMEAHQGGSEGRVFAALRDAKKARCEEHGADGDRYSQKLNMTCRSMVRLAAGEEKKPPARALDFLNRAIGVRPPVGQVDGIGDVPRHRCKRERVAMGGSLIGSGRAISAVEPAGPRPPPGGPPPPGPPRGRVRLDRYRVRHSLPQLHYPPRAGRFPNVLLMRKLKLNCEGPSHD